VTLASSLALTFASVKFLSRAHSLGEAEFSRTLGLFVRTLLTTTSIGAAVAFAVTLTNPAVWGEQMAAQQPVLLLALLTVPCMALHGMQVNIFASRQRPRTASLVLLSGTSATAVAAVCGLLLFGLVGVYAGNLIALVTVTAIITVLLRRRFGEPFGGTSP